MTHLLANVHDHPSVLAEELAAECSLMPVDDIHAEARKEDLIWGLRQFGQFLRDYEAEKSVTFAALDNDAWTSLKEVWSQARHAIDEGGHADDYTVDLLGAITDLLGIE